MSGSNHFYAEIETSGQFVSGPTEAEARRVLIEHYGFSADVPLRCVYPTADGTLEAVCATNPREFR